MAIWLNSQDRLNHGDAFYRKGFFIEVSQNKQ